MPPNKKPHLHSVPSSYLTSALEDAIYAKNQQEDDEAARGSTFPILTAEASDIPNGISTSGTLTTTKEHDNDDGVLGGPDLEADPAGSTLRQSRTTTTTTEASLSNPQQQQHHHKEAVRTILKKFSSTVQDPEELTLDEKRIQHALRDAGKYVYGIQGISVWLFDEDHDRLVLPPGGFWYHATNHEPSDAIDTVMEHFRANHHGDPSSSSVITPVAPGTDIAGILWLEGSNNCHSFWHSPHLLPPESPSLLHRASDHHHNSRQAEVETTPGNHHHQPRESSHATSSSIVWRDLKSLVQDPDVAQGPSLVLLEQAGFGQAAGIPFHAGVCSGLVIFFVKSGLDPKLLNNTVHTAYLYQSAQFIGTAAALTEARRATIGHQMHQTKEEANGTSTMVSSDDARKQNETLEVNNILEQECAKTELLEEEPMSQTPTCSSLVRRRLYAWLSKVKGGGLQVPPALSTRQAIWTTFGAFCGLMVLAALNFIYMDLSDDYYFLLVEPFGALMTLQYGLTAAPASQPRNAILGQVVSGAVALPFTYIPEYILAAWLRRAIAPAIAIGVMVKLGVTHPPAGAHAIVYSSGKYNFAFYGLVVLSAAVSTIPATLVNNMSRKRQYPTFWGFPSFLTNLFSGTSKASATNT